tara:strand:+ start:2021 stop:2431 length:411 start_codon:yes stop_codon:yes gene_type:complete
MKILIIFINFILITLILYNVLNSKIIEGLSGCSGSNKNAVYRQQALTNRLFSELNKLKAQYGQLNIQKTRNTSLINVNKMRMKSATKSINDSKKEKEKELDDLESSDSVPGEDDLATGDGGAGGFAAVMKNSKDSV